MTKSYDQRFRLKGRCEITVKRNSTCISFKLVQLKQGKKKTSCFYIRGIFAREYIFLFFPHLGYFSFYSYVITVGAM